MGRKKQVWEGVEITGIADRGKSVGRDVQGRVIFVDGAVPGDIIDALVLRKKKGTWYGVTQQIREPSPDREKPPCQHFTDCGGCKWQNLAYKSQLKHKALIVEDAMRRLAKLPSVNIAPILGAEQIFHYRNKMEFSFSNQRWKTKQEIANAEPIIDDGALGLHPPGFFNKVVDIQTCLLQDVQSDLLRNYIRSYARGQNLSFFDPIHHSGFLRNMIIRNSRLGQWMLVLSVAEDRMDLLVPMMDSILNEFPWLDSLHYVINQKKNDTLFDQDIICYHGQSYIEEQLGNLIFKIRPKSFFQTNSYQAERLYKVAKSYADLRDGETLYDLYTGTGTIALFLAGGCKEVVGIEEMPDAIADANENALANGITQAHFYVGDVRKILEGPILNHHSKPDVVVTDPPRMGMHEQVLKQIIELDPKRIVYISCNPATQARDLSLLKQNYQVEKMQPVDMFPHTNHIENVALLIKSR